MNKTPKSTSSAAKASFEGILHQFIVALEKCFEMTEGESVWIEQDGDVSTILEQTEVKKYSDELSDSHENFWKTLNNWLDDDFDHTRYKSLVLLTTQKFSPRTVLNKWNKSGKTKRLQLLTGIRTQGNKRHKTKAEKAKPKKLKKANSLVLMANVLSKEKREKLLDILEKIIILDNSPETENIYSQIRDRYLKGIELKKNKNLILKGLLGYILSPEISKEQNSWEITYQNFSKEVEGFTAEFSSKTVSFPRLSDQEISDAEIENFKKHLFVKKIEEIDYDDVIGEAIIDYIRAQKVLIEELRTRGRGKQSQISFEEELIYTFNNMYRSACRRCNKDDEINASKQFYDDVTLKDSPALENYNNTPMPFKNGVLHRLLDDDEKKLKWKVVK